MSVTCAWGGRRPRSSAAVAPAQPAHTITTDMALSTRGRVDPNVGARQRSGVRGGEPADDTGDLLRRKRVLADPRDTAHLRGDAGGADSVDANPDRPAFDGQDLRQSSQSR